MKFYKIVPLLLALGLIGCASAGNDASRNSINDYEEEETQDEENDNEQPADENTAEPVADTTEPEPDEPNLSDIKENDVHYIDISVQTVSDYQYTDDSEDKRLFFSSYYPRFSVDKNSYERLFYYFEMRNAEYEGNLAEEADMASEFFDPETDYGYWDYTSAQVTRSDSNLVSIAYSSSSYMGGAHPDSYYTTLNIEPDTATIISLADILNPGQDEILAEAVEEKLFAEYGTEPFTMVDDISDYILETLSMNGSLNFTLDHNGIQLYFSPYELTYYAAGDQVVYLPYSEYPDLIKEEYMICPEDYITIIPREGMILPNGSELTISSDEDDYLYLNVTVTLNGKAMDPIEYFYSYTPYLLCRDGKYYLYLDMLSDNDYHIVHGIDLNGDKPVMLFDDMDGRLMNSSCNPDALYFYVRTDMLSTISGTRVYRAEEDGTLTPVTFEYDLSSTSFTLTTLQEITGDCYYSADGSEDFTEYTLDAGTTLYFYSTDNFSYVDFKTDPEDEGIIRLYVDTDYPRTVDGVDIMELFDGVLFAG